MWLTVMFLVLVAAIVTAAYLSWMHSGGVATYIEEKSREFVLGYKFPWL
jgi:hypothetical protein